ncbi:BTAD domain-containing putative transcriptional regulator [Streptomyces sp. NPDC060002]|uniref:AfsR/SARP family transcriptional regulator n=1 Tax=Streptomyces sp. NPDC060002 TaxID=3347033 RepID=UPI0036A8DD83
MRFEVLGPVRVWREEGEEREAGELDPGFPQQRALLALLLTHAGRPVPTSEAVDVLWAERPPASALNVVRRYAGALRRLLEPGLPPRAPGRRLLRRTGGYLLEAATDEVDLLRFRELTRQGKRAAATGRPETAARQFVLALGEWRGPVAMGIPASAREHVQFTAVQRELLETARLAADAALLCGHAEQALPALRRATAHDPFDEPLHARLMLVLAACGLQAEALGAYEDVRRRLTRELGLTPGTELAAAHTRVLRQDVGHRLKSGPVVHLARPSETTRTTTTPAAVTRAATTPAAVTRAATIPAAVTRAAVTRAAVTRAATTPAAMTRAATTSAAVTRAAVTRAATTPAATTRAAATAPAAVTPAAVTPAATTPAATARAAVTRAVVTPAATTPAATTRAATTRAAVTRATTTPAATTPAPTEPSAPGPADIGVPGPEAFGGSAAAVGSAACGSTGSRGAASRPPGSGAVGPGFAAAEAGASEAVADPSLTVQGSAVRGSFAQGSFVRGSAVQGSFVRGSAVQGLTVLRSVDPGFVSPSAADHGAVAAPGPAAPGEAGGLGRPADAPAGRGVVGSVRPAQLPPALPSFVGRAVELDGLERAAGSAAGVVLVGGMAGIGKSTLALHWAHRATDRFPDGQLYVALRGSDPVRPSVEPADALRGMLAALGVPAPRMPDGVDALTGMYRTLLARRRVLVVLDDAAGTGQLSPLLPTGPGCLALVTSRHTLPGLVASGARPLRLAPPSAEDAYALLAGRIGAERAAAEPRAADEIVARCGRLPLALATVAARAVIRRDFPLAAVAAGLREAHGSLDALVAIREAFLGSYRLLTPDGARLLRLLPRHEGPDITAAGAAVLAGLPVRRARMLLGVLADAHLLAEPAPGHYTLHDLLRVFATERAAAEDRPHGP